MGPEKQKLLDRLFPAKGPQTKNFHVSRGDGQQTLLVPLQVVSELD